jgi:methyl-accepting chemotaxis protein
VTQQNAANAEESASSSEEMNAQAEQMKLMVDDLVTLVGGSAHHHTDKSTAAMPRKDRSKASLGNGHSASHAALAPAPRSGREVTPEKAIPFDDDASFKDF